MSALPIPPVLLASLLAAPIAVGLIAMLLGGCSMQLSSMLPGGVSDTGPTVVRTSDPDVTGSIPLHMASTGNIPTGMSAIDWPLARAALRAADLIVTGRGARAARKMLNRSIVGVEPLTEAMLLKKFPALAGWLATSFRSAEGAAGAVPLPGSN